MGSDLDVIPLNVLSGVRVHPQLSACQTHSGHLVLQRRQLEGAGDDMMQQQLERKTSACYSQNNKKEYHGKLRDILLQNA
jgi:hypothetical protein